MNKIRQYLLAADKEYPDFTYRDIVKDVDAIIKRITKEDLNPEEVNRGKVIGNEFHIDIEIGSDEQIIATFTTHKTKFEDVFKARGYKQATLKISKDQIILHLVLPVQEAATTKTISIELPIRGSKLLAKLANSKELEKELEAADDTDETIIAVLKALVKEF